MSKHNSLLHFDKNAYYGLPTIKALLNNYFFLV